MEIEVRLHTILQKQTARGRVDKVCVTLSDEATLREVISLLDIHHDSDNILLVINGRNASLDDTVRQGDIVDLIPAIAGG